MAYLNKLKGSLGNVPGDLKDYRSRTSGPSSYKPAGPDSGAVFHTQKELAQSSSVLHQEARRHIVPPPPRRGTIEPKPSVSPIEHAAPAAPLAPARSARAPSISQPASSPVRGTPAPPYQHAKLHDFPAAASGRKLFSQFTKDDKEDFFSSLDNFFSTRLNVSATPSRANAPPAPTQSYSEPAPPPVSLATRPPPALIDGPTGSYPPPQSHSSSALSLLHYVLYEPYTTAWYVSTTPTPPPLVGRTDVRWSGSWSSLGDAKTLLGFVLFGDCSAAWYKLDWSAAMEKSGRLDASLVRKEARYRPTPTPWDGERLYAASERYGASIVQFSESAVAGGRPIARGECWDLASEALASIQNEPKPFPSIGRTHGHLIFYGKAGGRGEGVWRGGDEYVRPGDVVEWRKVQIREVGMGPGSYSTLGDPDHTAIVVAAGTPTQTPLDGQAYPIASLISLTVIEQSLGSPPEEKTYDMGAMSKGEVWIYRPVPLVEYIGTEIAAVWPPPCDAWEVGQLE